MAITLTTVLDELGSGFYEPSDYRTMARRAERGEQRIAAYLYLAASIQLGRNGTFTDSAERLLAVWVATAGKRASSLDDYPEPYVDSDDRARAITEAVGLRTMNGRRRSTPDAKLLVKQGVAPELAKFIADRLKEAHGAACAHYQSKSASNLRARAVTHALRLKIRRGKPSSAIPKTHWDNLFFVWEVGDARSKHPQMSLKTAILDAAERRGITRSGSLGEFEYAANIYFNHPEFRENIDEQRQALRDILRRAQTKKSTE